MTTYFIITASISAMLILCLLFGLKKVRDSATVYALGIMFALALSFCSLSISNLMTQPEWLKIFFHELKFLGEAVAPVLLLFEYIDYAGREDLIKRKYRKFFYIIPIITTILAVTSPWQTIFRADIYVYRSGGEYILGTGEFGPWFIVHIFYSYLTFLFGLVVMLAAWFKKPLAYRRQGGLLALTGLIPSVSAFFYFAGVIGDGGMDILLIFFALSAAINYFILTRDGDRDRFYKVKDLAVKYMPYPVIIFDFRGLLIDMNQAAAEVLALPNSKIGEMNIKEFMRFLLPERERFSQEKETEVVIGERCFNFSLKTILDEKNNLNSSVILLSEITTLKKSVDELNYLTDHDYFTGLLNRQAFRDKVNNIPPIDLPVAIVRVHLRSLRILTAIFGNEYADKLLRMAVNVTSEFCDAEHSSRMDKGDILLILKKSSTEAAEEVSRKITEQLKLLEEQGFPLSASIGYCLRKSEFESYERNLEETEAMLIDYGKYPTVSVIRANLSKRLGQNETRIGRLEDLCLKIATAMKLPPPQLKRLSLLCVVSDIGLFALPKEFLLKKGNFDNKEWEDYKTHPLRGYSIVKGSKVFEEVAEEILCSHERYDGYGYPNGLKAEEIPILSRVLYAAEGYMDAEDDGKNAEEYMNFYKAKKYDPAVIEALMTAIKVESQKL